MLGSLQISSHFDWRGHGISRDWALSSAYPAGGRVSREGCVFYASEGSHMVRRLCAILQRAQVIGNKLSKQSQGFSQHPWRSPKESPGTEKEVFSVVSHMDLNSQQQQQQKNVQRRQSFRCPALASLKGASCQIP